MQPRAIAGEFVAYGPSHWIVLAVFALGVPALVVVGRRSRAPLVSRVFGALVLALQLAIQVYSMVPPRWHLADSLPLQLSDLAGYAAAVALLTRWPWACALTYYWGITLSTQALFTPALQGADFPDIGFISFFTIHVAVAWAAVYLTWGVGIRPTWARYRFTVLVTACWAVSVFVFNALTGTDYGFLNAKPSTESLLDVLGPWPWYLIPEIALVLVIWALMTLPWTRRADRPARAAEPSGA